MKSGDWFRFDSAKVGFCLRRGAVAETLHGEEPKAGAAALQGWDFARGGAQKNRFAGDESGFFGGDEVERRDERDAARGVCFSDEGGKAEEIGDWCAARGRIS